MPDYFTHEICAEKIYDRLEDKYRRQIEDADLYRLGAQGGDLFFLYNISYRANIGRTLHTLDNVKLFSYLAAANAVYAAGFAAHYALDSTIHPIVYAFEGSCTAPFAHIRFETDLGLFTSRYFSIARRILPRERVLRCSAAIYAAMKPLFPPMTLAGVERCLARHFTYTKAALLSKPEKYVFADDYSSLSGALERAVSSGADCVRAVFDGNISSSLFGASFLEK